MIHSASQPTVQSAVKICFVSLDIGQWKRTDNTCEDSVPALWITHLFHHLTDVCPSVLFLEIFDHERPNAVFGQVMELKSLVFREEILSGR